MKKLFTQKFLSFSLLISTVFFVVSCAENQTIVNNVNEREANEIVVLLAAKGISAQKMQAATQGAAANTSSQYNISVSKNQSVIAMSILNSVGLPRIKGQTLLDLFAGTSLMTTDKEQTIRYQAGLEEEIKNTIRKIDGVLDADVQISFPSTDTTTETSQKPKAAVYVKHQGVFDNPNNHLETKIKRLVSGSVDQLEFDAVSVIADRARLSEMPLKGSDVISASGKSNEYVSIWSIVMTKASSSKFRAIFFFLLILVLVLGAASGWLVYRFYPQMIKTKFSKEKDSSPPSNKEK